MANKKRIATSVAAVATAAALLLGGTFAWQSISQTALNEASDIVNPGGRLHNDMWYETAETTNSNVYVENFAEDEIFARVRLSEYMEIVMNYGSAAEKVENVAGKKFEAGTNNEVTDAATAQNQYDYEYTTHYFHEANATDEYWTWDTDGTDAGDVYYMPTFNVNKDSLAPDLNGLYRDRVGGISNREAAQYVDLTEAELPEGYSGYSDGETKYGWEIYDADTNSDDELKDVDAVQLAAYIADGSGDDVYFENILQVEATHEADTVGATKGMMSLTDWLDMVWDEDAEDYVYDEELHGGYWVYDDTEDVDGDGDPDGDGWVYWSSPIAGKNSGNNTTGLLLDGFTLKDVMDDTWYYAIEVTGQFITADDLGEPAATFSLRSNDVGSGFYRDGETVTDNALTLLHLIGVGRDNSGNDDDDEGGNNTEYYEGPSVAFMAMAEDSCVEYVTLGAGNVQLVAVTEYDYGEQKIITSYNISEWKLRKDVELSTAYSEGTTLTQNGLLTIGSDEQNEFIEIAATIADGEYAGQVINSSINVAMPWIEIEEVDETGSSLALTSTMIAAGETKYFKVSRAIIYQEYPEEVAYPGFDSISAEDITWTVSPGYPFEDVEAKVTCEMTESGLYKVNHSCTTAGVCSCAYPLDIYATLTQDKRASGFVSLFVSKSTNIDTMTLGVGHNVNEKLEYQYKFYEHSSDPHAITAYVTEGDCTINFSLGEWAAGSLIWMDKDGRELADGDGWLNENGQWTPESQVSGIMDLSAQTLTLDSEEKIPQLTLVGKYEKNDDYSGVTLNQDTRITLNFNFVWVGSETGGEIGDDEEFSIYCMNNSSMDGESEPWYNGEIYRFTTMSSENVTWSIECDDLLVSGKNDDYGNGTFEVTLGYDVPAGTKITVTAETDGGESDSINFTVTKIESLTLVHGSTETEYQSGETIYLETLNSDYWFYTDETHRVYYDVEGSSIAGDAESTTHVDINNNLVIGDGETGTDGELTLILKHWDDANLTSSYTLVLPTP